MRSTKTGKMVSTEVQSDMQTKLNLITEHTIKDKHFKFTSLAHLLNENSLVKKGLFCIGKSTPFYYFFTILLWLLVLLLTKEGINNI